MNFARQTELGKPKPRPSRSTPAILSRKGWSANAAAREIGVSTGHLIRVLNGERPQGRVLPKVKALPNLRGGRA